MRPQELVRSELWFWRGLLNATCQVRYLPACPMMIADWNDFMGMWSNDGIAEAIAMAATNRRDLARAAILNWFRYAVNAKGDGTCPWTIFPSGRNTFQATDPERDTQGVLYEEKVGDVPSFDAGEMRGNETALMLAGQDGNTHAGVHRRS